MIPQNPGWQFQAILTPIFTEKSSLLGDRCNQFVFEVDRRTNKFELKKALEAIYGVQVKKVQVVVMKGQSCSFQRYPGRHATRKKAIFTLKRGFSIDFTKDLKS